MPVWEEGYLGEGMHIGILDTLVQRDHPDLRDNLPVSNLIEYYRVRQMCSVENQHGTQVAGLIAAKDNGEGMVGVAPRATLYSYGVLSSQRDQEANDVHIPFVTAALNSTEHVNIAVYNGSIAAGESSTEIVYSPLNADLSRAMDNVLQRGFNGLGSALVFSAGNAGSMMGSSSNAGFLNHHGAIGVNGLNKQGDAATMASTHGNNIWVASLTAGSFRRIEI